MREEYSFGDDNCPYSWLNEWLCEYVDGTMDPSLRRVFEKYVQANPELKAHVERLRHTRELLCRCSRASQQEASDEVRARVQKKVECDMLRTPESLRDAVRERPVTAFASTLVVALVIGMFAGATLFGPETVPTHSVQAVEETQLEDRPPVPGRVSVPFESHDARSASARAVSPASLYMLMDTNTGMPYVPTLDSTSNAAMWQPTVAVRP